MGNVKLLIAGSQDYSPTPAEIDAVMDDLLFVKADVTEVVSGGAKGADTAGETWAHLNGIPVKRFPADWNTYGKRAGFMRNSDMAVYADGALVFWKNQSNGSANMVTKMVALEKPVRVICWKR